MLIPLDYKDLLKLLNKHKARYLIVGAYAVIYYTEPRYTKDLDIWVEPTEKNAKKVYSVLNEFGAPLKGITVKDFTDKNKVYQIGVAPVRIDIIMNISNIEFDMAYKHKKIADLEGIKADIIGMDELIKAKEKTKRGMDKLDIERLRARIKLRGRE